MAVKDLIHNGEVMPTYEQVEAYFDPAIRALWLEMNTFLQNTYGAVPKLAYSRCAAQPGWNLKYQKSGKSLCTLYPEKESFIILIVVGLGLVPVIEAMAEELAPEIIETIQKAAPFNGTKWLMIPVEGQRVLESVKRLLLLKHPPKRLI